MSPIPTYWEAISRVFCRPWPWVIRYIGGLVPAVLVALMLLVPLQTWLSRPLVAEALETRSLDMLVDILTDPSAEIGGGPLLPAGLVLVPLVWIGMRMLWLFLEGGVLITYAQPRRPTLREFLRACFHWLPSFLLISGLALLATGVVVGIAAAGVALVQTLSLWPSLGTLVVIAGMLAIVGISAIAELARAAAVVGGARGVGRAFGAAGRIAARQFPSLAGLVLGTLLLRVVFFLVQRAVSGYIPLSWWLLTLLAQQLLQLLTTGLGLVRRACQVALASPEIAGNSSNVSGIDMGVSLV